MDKAKLKKLIDGLIENMHCPCEFGLIDGHADNCEYGVTCIKCWRIALGMNDGRQQGQTWEQYKMLYDTFKLGRSMERDPARCLKLQKEYGIK